VARPNKNTSVEAAIRHRFSGENHTFWRSLDPSKQYAVIPMLTHAGEQAGRGAERFMFDVVRGLGHDLTAQVAQGDVPLGLQGDTRPKRVAGKVGKLQAFLDTLGIGEAEGLKITVAKGCGG
jgi:hypothetical protein